MSSLEILTGQLLVAQPKNTEGHFSKSVILVAHHNYAGAWGVVVNRLARTVTMKNIMDAAGIEYTKDDMAYIGGPVEPTRVQVVHTLDWSSSNTLKVTDEIGITGDVSVLAAISQGQGPRHYRAGVGLAVWSAGQLDGEQSGQSPWTPEHRWLTTPATADLIFNDIGEEQWQSAIDATVRHRISTLF